MSVRRGAILTGAIAAVLAIAARHRATSALSGAPSPSFSLPDLWGAPVTLEAFRGRPLLLNFWATWCGPCRTELPDLQALATGESGCLAIVGIAVNSGSAAQVAAFARARGVAYPILMGDQRVMADYHVDDIPRSVLLDARGHEAAHWVGAISPERVREAVLAIAPAGVHC